MSDLALAVQIAIDSHEARYPGSTVHQVRDAFASSPGIFYVELGAEHFSVPLQHFVSSEAVAKRRAS